MSDLRDKILALENVARELEPNAAIRAYLREKVVDYTEDFLDKIHDTNVWNESLEKGIGLYDDPVSEDSSSIEKMLESFEENVDHPHLNAASGGHLGYVPGGGLYVSALGDYIADVTNNYSGIFYASPGAVRMENMMINWMSEIIGYPANAVGNLASGGSVANLIAIVTARDAHNIKGKDYEKTVIYASDQMHHCLDKAIRISGLGEAVLRHLPLDEGYRIIPEKLDEMIEEDRANGLKPFLVIASAGTTDVGAVDPLDKIGVIAKKHDLWYHIDGAYGAFFVLLEEEKHKLKGIELSDSVVMDPHKGLFLPYGLGVVLVKEAEHMLKSHHYQANYMQDANNEGDEYSPADLSPELTKHFRGLRMWLPLKIHGLVPFRACLEEKIWLARYFREEVAKIPGVEVGPAPDLSITWFRFIPDDGDANEFNEELLNLIRLDGRVFLSSTLLEDKFVIRFACLSFRTHLERVDLLLSVIKEKVAVLQAALK